MGSLREPMENMNSWDSVRRLLGPTGARYAYHFSQCTIPLFACTHCCSQIIYSTNRACDGAQHGRISCWFWNGLRVVLRWNDKRICKRKLQFNVKWVTFWLNMLLLHSVNQQKKRHLYVVCLAWNICICHTFNSHFSKILVCHWMRQLNAIRHVMKTWWRRLAHSPHQNGEKEDLRDFKKGSVAGSRRVALTSSKIISKVYQDWYLKKRSMSKES